MSLGICLEILMVAVLLRWLSRQIDSPKAGEPYDLHGLITTIPDPPFEQKEKTFASPPDVNATLTVDEIRDVLKKSKELSQPHLKS